MAKVYNEEFKKQLVKEYIQGKSYPSLEKEYGVAKPALSGWVKKYSGECQIPQPHTTNFPVFSPKEIQALHKRTAELEKPVQSTYDDKVKGLIPEVVCIELLDKYQTERTEKAAQLRELEQQIADRQCRIMCRMGEPYPAVP